MHLLFCNNPFENKQTIDFDFEEEFVAARKNGYETHLFSYESLTKEDPVGATNGIKRSPVLLKIMYRGWMLKPKHYGLLYQMLLTKNYQLINTPEEYQNCHYLPDSYPFIKAHTPKTVWLKVDNQNVDYEAVFECIKTFGASPLLVKDFVKSQKHYWHTACYIPTAEDTTQVKSVIQKFVELQSADLNEGLVIREFVPLQDLATHSKSGMPLKQEYRLFFGNGHLLGCYNYWEEGEYATVGSLPLDVFTEIATKVESNFFCMDVAKTKEGEWIIIELGDGQVAGLPESADKELFYENGKAHFLKL